MSKSDGRRARRRPGRPDASEETAVWLAELEQLAEHDHRAADEEEWARTLRSKRSREPGSTGEYQTGEYQTGEYQTGEYRMQPPPMAPPAPEYPSAHHPEYGYPAEPRQDWPSAPPPAATGQFPAAAPTPPPPPAADPGPGWLNPPLSPLPPRPATGYGSPVSDAPTNSRWDEWDHRPPPPSNGDLYQEPPSPWTLEQERGPWAVGHSRVPYGDPGPAPDPAPAGALGGAVRTGAVDGCLACPGATAAGAAPALAGRRAHRRHRHLAARPRALDRPALERRATVTGGTRASALPAGSGGAATRPTEPTGLPVAVAGRQPPDPARRPPAATAVRRAAGGAAQRSAGRRRPGRGGAGHRAERPGPDATASDQALLGPQWRLRSVLRGEQGGGRGPCVRRLRRQDGWGPPGLAAGDRADLLDRATDGALLVLRLPLARARPACELLAAMDDVITPWLDSYPPGVPEHIEVPETNLARLLDSAARDFANAPALHFEGRTTSYAQLADQAWRFAGALAGLGVTKGTRVGLLLPNCPQAVVALFGALRLVAVGVQNNPLSTG